MYSMGREKDWTARRKDASTSIKAPPPSDLSCKETPTRHHFLQWSHNGFHSRLSIHRKIFLAPRKNELGSKITLTQDRSMLVHYIAGLELARIMQEAAELLLGIRKTLLFARDVEVPDAKLRSGKGKYE